MLKDILEVIGVVLSLVLAAVACTKYSSALKTAKEFSSAIGAVYDRIKEVETSMHKAMALCQSNHGEFNKEVGSHIKDRAIHRDSELESFRYDTLAKAIVELKADLATSMSKIEGGLCSRIEKLEVVVHNGVK